MLYHGLWTTGYQTASTGLVTTEFGMNLKAIILDEERPLDVFSKDRGMHLQQEEPRKDCLLQPVRCCISSVGDIIQNGPTIWDEYS